MLWYEGIFQHSKSCEIRGVSGKIQNITINIFQLFFDIIGHTYYLGSIRPCQKFDIFRVQS